MKSRSHSVRVKGRKLPPKDNYAFYGSPLVIDEARLKAKKRLRISFSRYVVELIKEDLRTDIIGQVLLKRRKFLRAELAKSERQCAHIN